MGENIRPAISLQDDSKQEMSPENFQKQLYEWFEQKGILNELRAHLRQQMISMLKGTGSETPSKSKISPKKQTIVLLVAEFLFCESYHYTLCVFNTEEPLMKAFPTKFINNNSDDNDKKFRFTITELNDILETFGLSKDSQILKNISNFYYNNPDESLLSCMIRILPDLCYVDSKNLNEFTTNGFLTFENLDAFLHNFFGNIKHGTDIKNCIKSIIDKERNEIRQKQDVSLQALKEKLENECETKVEKYKRRCVEMEKIFEIERQKLEKELQLTNDSLKECAENLQLKLAQLDKKERLLKAREKQINKKEESINKLSKKQKAQSDEISYNKTISRKLDNKRLQKDEICEHCQKNRNYKNVSSTENSRFSNIQETKSINKQGKNIREKLINENDTNEPMKTKIDLTQTKNYPIKSRKDIISKTDIIESKNDQINSKSNHELQNQNFDSMEKSRSQPEIRNKEPQLNKTIHRKENADKLDIYGNISCKKCQLNKQMKGDDIETNASQSACTCFKTNENQRDLSGKFESVNFDKDLNKIIQNLHSENDELRKQNQEQKVQVQELARNAKILIAKLKNSQGVHQNQKSDFFTYQKPQCKSSSSCSTSDDYSPTENVLKEARIRLRKLEMESAEIEKNFREYNVRNKNRNMNLQYSNHQQEDYLGRSNFPYNLDDNLVNSQARISNFSLLNEFRNSKQENENFFDNLKNNVDRNMIESGLYQEELVENRPSTGHSSGYLLEELPNSSISTIDFSSDKDSVKRNTENAYADNP